MNHQELSKLTGMDVYPASVSTVGAATYFLARKGSEKFVGCAGGPCLPNVKKLADSPAGCVCAGPLDGANAAAIRTALPWTAPRCLGLATSVGMGDRLGLATPGHLRAVRGSGLAAILAQQSIREMTRTRRTAQDVMDCATFGVLQEGWRDGFGSDADHIQKPEDLDTTAAAGFTMFTIDPGAHVNNEADAMPAADLAAAYARLDFATLATTPGDLKRPYLLPRLPFAADWGNKFDDASFTRAAVKYGSAIAHTVKMHRHLAASLKRPFELEISVDETACPTSPAEHYFFAAELKRLGVKWVSLAPRFIGRFEKGVDYIGDLAEFRRSFAAHTAVMRAVGPYKMSIHSGSDKFSVYPIVAELAGEFVHLKTAGTSYLEALRAVARIEPSLFRDILEFARGRYDTDKASYHVSAEASKVPLTASMASADLAALIDNFDARQVLHCTFGSVLTADDGARFKKSIYAVLARDEETHYAALQTHLGRHIAPFSK